jgi:hypothetical protein
MFETLTIRQARHARSQETVKRLEKEFIKSWDKGGEKDATILLADKNATCPQQKQLHLQAFKNVSYIANISRV